MEDRLEVIRRGYEEGISAAEIADSLGLNRNQVIGRAYRAGFQHKNSGAQQRSAKTRRKNAKQRGDAALAQYKPIVSYGVLPMSSRCKFPIGDPGDPDFGYCEHRQSAGGPYCAHHHAMCYVDPERTRKAKQRNKEDYRNVYIPKGGKQYKPGATF